MKTIDNYALKRICRKDLTMSLLHNLYCSLEDIFQEIAKTFENKVEDPAKYHRELLKRMYMDIPGIRPRLLSQESYRVLDELRGFRHIFRHAYDYELDPERIGDLKQKIIVNWNYVWKDLHSFMSFLQETMRD
jgi:uncharacterized protein YutE (UPF0331/DUF86 family)